jgi:hypothetical protein
MSKTISEKQLAANRLNAKKSTGPKTAGGKAIVSLNAVRHGMLAHQIIAQGNNIQESPDEFDELCEKFYADLAPEGATEEMLVDQIAQLTWRLRRAHRAESGEVALSVDNGCFRRIREGGPPYDHAPKLLAFTVMLEGLGRMVSCYTELAGALQVVLQNVERHGELTDTAFYNFKLKLYKVAGPIIREIEALRVKLSENPEKLEPEALGASSKKQVIKYLNEKIRSIEFWLKNYGRMEAVDEGAKQLADVLPSAKVLEKILRYETALHRQLFRTMNQLDILQERRLNREEAEA